MQYSLGVVVTILGDDDYCAVGALEAYVKTMFGTIFVLLVPTAALVLGAEPHLTFMLFVYMYRKFAANRQQPT